MELPTINKNKELIVIIMSKEEKLIAKNIIVAVHKALKKLKFQIIMKS